MRDTSVQTRRFLFLQGNASPFFARLAQSLRSNGHSVHRINFNGGDVAFWPLPGAVDFTDKIARWPAFLANRLSEWGVTDIVLLGDCRPLHRHAISVAARFGVAVYVFEEGYLRPNWITLEVGGVNAYSSLGRDPQWFVETANGLPPWSEPEPAINSMMRRAIDDIRYVLATTLGAWRFTGYRSHRAWSSWVEYTGGARRFVRKPSAMRRLSRLLDDLAAANRPYYLFPLQIQSDSQIQYHSDFDGIGGAIDHVLQSFAAAAPDEAALIITEHPLDTSPFDWRRLVADLSRRYGVADRVWFFEGGSPERTIHGCRGVVTVNSTLGYLALSLGKPLIALGSAIYDIERLTFQHGLDRFWRELAPPDPVIFDAFRRVVAARTQVNGSFYSASGVALAVERAVRRIEADINPQRMISFATRFAPGTNAADLVIGEPGFSGV